MLMDCAILLALLVLNGFLSMSETALISCRRSHVQARLEDIPHAKILDDLLSRPGEFISALQIGITIISIFSGAYSGQVLAEPLGAWLNTLPRVQGYGFPLAFGIVVITMTYVSLLISELVPKRIAISYSELIALRVARIVRRLTQTSFFMVSVLDRSAKVILRLLGVSDSKKNSITEEELHYLLRQGAEEGTISVFEHDVFRRVLGFGATPAHTMMTTRARVVVLHAHDDIANHIHTVTSQPHRYYPVTQGHPEQVLGVVDAKDLMERHTHGKLNSLQEIMRTAPSVLTDQLGPDLLQAFNHHAPKIALVVDEQGLFQGIITPHDLLEHLIGPFSLHHLHKHIRRHKEGAWT